MTTATEIPVKWDHFLEERHRPQVEGFRRATWPTIKRELSKVGYTSGLEPCWVAPGRAIFWHRTISRIVVTKLTDDGREYREHEDLDRGFGPTGDLPANNHSVIAKYLKKGFLLRPPGQEDVEEEAAVPESEPAQTKTEYICYRHGEGRMAFTTWKAYILHLVHYKEAGEYDLPEDVMERAKTFKFYCPVHDRGFNQASHAGRHRKAELKKPGRGYHPSMEDMDMSVTPAH